MTVCHCFLRKRKYCERIPKNSPRIAPGKLGGGLNLDLRRLVFLSDCGKIPGVNQASETQNEPRRPLGALACVTTGFEVAARHLELILLPLLLDLFLWLGPRLSVSPLLMSIKNIMSQLMTTDIAVPETTENYVRMIQLLEELSGVFNLFSLLNPGPLLGLPALMSSRMSALTPMGEQSVVEVASFLVVMAAVVVLVIVGLGLNALYLRTVGKRVIAETEAAIPGPRTIWVVWRQFVEFGLVLYVALFIFSMAVSLFATIVGLFSFLVAGLIMAAMLSIALFVAVHLLFTVPGMVQLRRGLFHAMKESLLLTRADFINVMFLLGLVLVISRGLNVVWMLPEPDSWTTFVGLGGHAFVSTALTAGLFIFYQERLRYLEAMKQIFAAQVKETPAPSALGNQASVCEDDG